VTIESPKVANDKFQKPSELVQVDASK